MPELHQREVIREYVVAMLVGKTVAGTKVEDTRTEPCRKTELPLISVYTPGDTVDQEKSKTEPREYTRDLKLEIVGWVLAGPGVAARMDALALQIEKAMNADRYLGVPAAAADTTLEDTGTTISRQGEELMGMVLVTYSVTYRTPGYVEPDEPDEFLTAGVEYPTAGSSEDTEVPSDLVTVRPTP